MAVNLEVLCAEAQLAVLTLERQEVNEETIRCRTLGADVEELCVGGGCGHGATCVVRGESDERSVDEQMRAFKWVWDRRVRGWMSQQMSDKDAQSATHVVIRDSCLRLPGNTHSLLRMASNT